MKLLEGELIWKIGFGTVGEVVWRRRERGKAEVGLGMENFVWSEERGLVLID